MKNKFVAKIQLMKPDVMSGFKRSLTMKKMTFGAVLVAMMAIGTHSYGAFTRVDLKSVLATVLTAGTAKVDFTLEVASVQDPTVVIPGANLTWPGGIDPSALGPNTWAMADKVLVMSSTVTLVNSGIQILTDNTQAWGGPLFEDPTPLISSNTDSNPAGLVLNTGQPKSSDVLPLAWSIKPSSQTAAQLASASPTFGAKDGPANKYQWIPLSDRQTPAIDYNGDDLLNTNPVVIDGSDVYDSVKFVNGNAGSTMIDINGVQYAQSTVFRAAHTLKSFIYFEADFATALPQNNYSTRIYVESFTE